MSRYAYPGRFNASAVIDDAGNVQAGEPVHVFEPGTTIPVQLYSDLLRTTMSNPVTLDAHGNLEFFAEPAQDVDLVLDLVGVLQAAKTVTIDKNPMESEPRNWFDPERRLGGDATGVTAATAVLNDAFSQSRFIFLRPGSVWRIDDSIYPQARTVIWAFGATIVIDSPTSIFGLRIEEDDVHVLGAEMYSTDPTIGHAGFCVLAGASRATFEFCYAHDIGQFGFDVGDLGTNGGSSRHTFRNCFADMSNCYTGGACGFILFPKGGADFLADGCTIENCGVELGTGPAVCGFKVASQRGGSIDAYVHGGVISGLFEGGIDVVFCYGTVIESSSTVVDCPLGIDVGGFASPGGVRNRDITVGGTVDNSGMGAGSYCLASYEGMTGLKIKDFNARAGLGIAIFLTPFTQTYADLEMESVTVEGGVVSMLCSWSADRKLGFHGASLERVICRGPTFAGVSIQGHDIAMDRVKVFGAANFAISVDGERPIITRSLIDDCNTGDTADVAGITWTGDDGTVENNTIINRTAAGRLRYGLRPSAGLSRTDAGCGTTSGSPTVTDTAIAANDDGQPVFGAGVPAQAYVGDVVVGVSFKIKVGGVDANATATATVGLVIGPTASRWGGQNSNTVIGMVTAPVDVFGTPNEGPRTWN